MKVLLLSLCLIIVNSAYAQYSPQRTAEIANSRFQDKLDEMHHNWDLLNSLNFYNKINSAKIDQYRKTLKAEWEPFTKEYYTSNSLSYFDTYNNRINEYLNDQNIKLEIEVEGKIGSEILQMRTNNPGKFTEFPRYKELQQVIQQIIDCSPNEIKSIAIKHALLY